MKNIFQLVALIVLLASAEARAVDFAFDAGAFYYSDELTSTNKGGSGATLLSAFAGFGIDKKNKYEIGWHYGSQSTSSIGGASTGTYSASEMGPGVVVYFDKDRTFRAAASYDLVSTGTYAYTGATSEKWTGTAINGDIGYQFRFDSSFSFGLRVNYSSSSFTQKVVGTTSTAATNSKSTIYPSIAVTIEM